jgi:hypothetical protein
MEIITNQILKSPYYINSLLENQPEDKNKGQRRLFNSSKSYKFVYEISGYKEFKECYVDTIKNGILYQYIEK